MISYKSLLEEMRANALPDEEGPIAPSPTGFVSRKSNTPPSPENTEYDPVGLLTEWMKTIKTSGENARKKAEALRKNQPVPEEPIIEEKKAEEAPKDEEHTDTTPPLPSMFGEDEYGDDFTLPEWNGDKGEMVSLARQAANEVGVPEGLFLHLIKQESGFNPRAKSSAGAYGLAQLMPGTADYLGVNSHDPKENVLGGARYLKEQYDTFGSWPLALAAYNAGPGAVKEHGGIPPYKETKNYVRSILGS